GVFFVDGDAFGATEVLQRSAFQIEANFFGNYGTARQNRQILQHGFAAIAEARCFNSSDFDDAADVVHNQRRQCFAFNVFGNDHQRTRGFCNLLQQRQQIADRGDFLVDQQDERIVEFDNHFVLLVDEVRRQVAAVKLHAFNDIEFVVEAGAFFNGDDTFFTDFFHRVGDDVADVVVAVGGDRTDLCNRFGIGARRRQFLDLLDGSDNGFVDTALQVHRVGASGNRLQAFDNDRLRQNGGGGGAVTGGVGSLGSHFFHELGAHVFEFVFQFDFFRYGNTVFGYGRCAEGFVDDNVAAFRAQGHFDC